MRKITDHVVNPANDKIEITVLDEPGAGGASHHYSVTGFDTEGNAAASVDGYVSSFSRLPIIFQNGPINESGVNGITQEVLLAIVVDRLRSFQAGPYACPENALALSKIEEAQHWLLSRTGARMARGVEGTHTV